MTLRRDGLYIFLLLSVYSLLHSNLIQCLQTLAFIQGGRALGFKINALLFLMLL